MRQICLKSVNFSGLSVFKSSITFERYRHSSSNQVALLGKKKWAIKASFKNVLLLCSIVEFETNWHEKKMFQTWNVQYFFPFQDGMFLFACLKLILVCPLLSSGAFCNCVSQILAVRAAFSFRPWSVLTELCFFALRPSKVLSNGAKCCSTCVKTLPLTSRSIPPLRPKRYNSPIVQFYLRSKGCHLTALWKPTAQALTRGRSSLLAQKIGQSILCRKHSSCKFLVPLQPLAESSWPWNKG